MAKVFLHWYSSAELHLAIENLGKLGNHGQGNIAKENMLGKIMGKKIIAKVMIIDKIWVYVAKVISAGKVSLRSIHADMIRDLPNFGEYLRQVLGIL